MNNISLDISKFKRDDDFYGELHFVCAVKSFDLQQIRQRYLGTIENKNIGSFKRREVSIGGLVSYQIKKGKLEKEDVVLKTKEPRAIDIYESKIAFASENKVIVVDEGAVFHIENEWFSYIHTVEFSKKRKDIVLISSSGFDCFFEFNYKTGEKVFEWFAWENGFDKGIDTEGKERVLTRNKQVLEKIKPEGVNIHLVDPKNGTLPTAQRTAFINSVSYSKDEKAYLVTFFHRGEVLKIDSKQELVFDGLQSPHGGKEIEKYFVATDTRGGRVLLKNENEMLAIDFKLLSGKPEYLNDKEWLQNSSYQNNIVITIDSNRTSFVIYDIERKLYSIIPYNDDYAVQDIVFGKLNTPIENQLKSI